MSNEVKVVNKIVMKKLNEIKPYFRNPRSNEKTVEMLVKVIPQVGFNVPILIDKNGVIVKGHARYKAAFKLGMEEVPCVITDADEEQIKLDRITDNRISELSEWLEEGLMHEIDMLDIGFDDILKDLDLRTDVIESEFDNTELEQIDFNEPNVTDEEKQKIYEEMLAKKEEEAKARLEKEIQKAEEKQVKEQLPQAKKYVKCVCSKCGEVFFIDFNKIIVVEM
jgi:ParB family transcriptional regulator, chromosome partitioning protein